MLSCVEHEKILKSRDQNRRFNSSWEIEKNIIASLINPQIVKLHIA